MISRALIALALTTTLGGEVKVAGDGKWVDTGIAIQAGDTVAIQASGTVQLPKSAAAGPSGLPRGWKDVLRNLPLNDAGRGALLGRIGDSAAARPFVVGEKLELRAPVSGKLFLASNVAGETGEGGFEVNVSVAKGTGPAEFKGALPGLTQEQLDSIPVRVSDHAGTPGDRTNFIIFGAEEQVRQALKAAGWVLVDRTVTESVLNGLLVTLNKGAYVTMPMSELELFGRPQDFGYAQADPLRVVLARHHFRIWKAPFQAGDLTVWVGAGTEDIGFDRDQRNGKLTHKIDPDTDKERDYIGESLQQTGLVVKTAYMMPSNPVKTARTAHGEEFTSDGRTLLIWLNPDSPAKEAW
ncbi:MAG: LssY C-terminal domain-containing protein [Bryobacterales bacterium]|nr:LssY C-terminal domain-containing protein [Bryobacterales bacterium]